VLVTQNFPDQASYILNPNLAPAPGSGSFVDQEAGYGPYAWGTSSWFNLFDNTASIPSYTVNFYFLDGQPNYCSLFLAVIGLAEFTTNTVSQLVTFRAEYDLSTSAHTALNGILAAGGASGTIIGSAYSRDSHGDSLNTGWALFQPNNNLLTTTLPGGSYPVPPGPLPYLTLTVNQQQGDGFGLTVGYTCCTNCITGLTIYCPTNKTVQCGSIWTFDPPSGSSCCGSNVTVTTMDTVTNSGVCLINFIGGGSAAVGVINFVGNTATSGYLDITDGSKVGTYPLLPGLGSDGYFSWNGMIFPATDPFVDSFGLLFTGSGLEINLFGNGPGSYSLAGAPPAYAPSVTNGVATIAVCPQTITRTWLIADDCGHTNTCSQTVTVVSTNPPVLNCASNKTVQCGTLWSFNAPMVTDACSGSNVVITVASTVTNGVCPQVITRTWLVIDACGNTNTCSQIVTVVDTTPPVLTCASDKTVQCGTAWSFDAPTVSDICSGTNVTLTILSTVTNGVCPQVITQTWLAIDACFNNRICSQTVTVVDTMPPVLTCATNKTVACGTNWTFDPPAVTDACCGTNVTLTFSTVTNGTSPLVITRTWQATDCCSNSSIPCSQTVTVMTNCCVTLSNESVVCAGNGTYTYSFDFRNDSSQTAYSLLMADVNENPVFADPLIYFTPPLLTGQTRHLSVTIVSDTCGQLCFYLVPHTQTFEDCCSLTNCITLPGCCSLPRTYNSTADFAKGTLLNLANQNNQLCFPDHITPFPYVNMACSGRGTIVRIDVNTGQVLGEYKTAPDSDYPGGPIVDLITSPSAPKYGPNPSRTTVDLLGNVWVANRDVNKNNYGTVTRYALVIGGTRVDALGNPDLNGLYLKPPFIYNSGAVSRHIPGLLKTSRGLGDILPWNGTEPLNGSVKTADDDCIINYTVVTSITGNGFGHDSGIRTIAVDCTNDVWVGGTVNKLANGVHLKLSGVTALPMPTTQFIGPNLAGGYGGVIDGHNVLWSARGKSLNLLRVVLPPVTLDTAPPCSPDLLSGIAFGCDLGSASGNYGLSVDPCTGNIWHTALTGNKVYVRGPAGNVIGSYSGRNPYPNGNTAQGVAVDEHGNVWIAHSEPNANTVGHITTTGAPVGSGVVDLTVDIYGNHYPAPSGYGHGPTGVAIDSNGKVWVSCYESSKAMRIDPSLGAGGVGAVDLVVDLNAWVFPPQNPHIPYPAASPYNYSDKTGFLAIGVTCPSGFWDFVQDACTAGANWGILSWTVSPGTQITVQVRAADNVTDPMTGLPSKLWTTVQNGVSFCGQGVTGQHLEVRVTLQRGTTSSCTNSTACLYSLTVQCCSTPPCWPGPPCWFNISLPKFVSVSNSVALTTNLSAVITQPSGLPTLVTWSVNGQVVQTNQIPGGPAPTQTTVDFVHTYQPGSNWVEVTASDGINPPIYAFTSVTVGDINPPTWQTLNAYETNAFVAVIPDVVASLNPNVLSDDWSPFEQIRVVQNPPAGMVVTQGVYWITLVARDAAGNQSTNSTSLAVGPVVTILSPDEYASFPTNTGTPVTVQIAANVADVVRVNYYLDSNLVATATSAPFGVNLTNVPAGSYSLTAEAVNPGGLTSRSTDVPVSFDTPEPVRIGFTNTASGFILTWPVTGNWLLQSTTNLKAGSYWETYYWATNPPFLVPMTNAERYFRLFHTN
jgi:hypothetical protein